MKCLVTGGRQRKPGECAEWKAYDKAVIALFDVDTFEAESVVEYSSPAEVCSPDEPSVLFKAAHLEGRILYVCTQTEILSYDTDTFCQLQHVSHKWLNDTHHVRPSSDKTLFIANTGLDMVLELSYEGELVNQWSVVEDDTWKRFNPDVDYRRVPTTKPHLSHPNYVFLYGKEVWATRFIQKDALCLTSPQKKNIRIEAGNPHDGLVVGEHVYFTTTNGHIIKASLLSCKVEKVFNLNEFRNLKWPMGWCRSIAFLSEDYVLVGFSRIRPTKIKQNIDWAKHALLGKAGYFIQPTNVTCFDLKSKSFVWEKNMEDVSINAIFSLHVI